MRMRTGRGPGFVGEIFGMGRHDQPISLEKSGRVVRLELPTALPYMSPVAAIGWIVDERPH
jgi:hypothetical protein